MLISATEASNMVVCDEMTSSAFDRIAAWKMRLRFTDQIQPVLASDASASSLYRLTTPRRTGLAIQASMAQNDESQTRDYQSRVTAQCLRNPCLQNLSKFLSDDNSNPNACRIVCLEFSPAFATPRREDLDLREFTSLLDNEVQSGKEMQGRLLLIEDVSKDVIKVLGSRLDVDPFFFASHIDIPQPDIATTRPYTATLPSVTKSQNFLTLHYHRVLALEHTAIKDRLLRDNNAPRKLKILPSVKGLDIGLARHCCSILEAASKDGSWLGKSCSLKFRDKRNHCS